MYNIYDMLKKGANADTIAKAFTEEMNSALKRIEEEKAANTKRAEFDKALEPLKAWTEKYYGKVDEDINDTVWKVVESVDSISSDLKSWFSL